VGEKVNKSQVKRYTAHQTQVTSDTKSSSACKEKGGREKKGCVQYALDSQSAI